MIRSNRSTATLALAVLLAAQLVSLPLPVSARVDPLSMLRRQIAKPNVLLVFDTSGSMTGVPGGNFTPTTEVGVDCDNGVDCAVPHCRDHPWKSCSTDSDCDGGVGRCSYTYTAGGATSSSGSSSSASAVGLPFPVWNDGSVRPILECVIRGPGTTPDNQWIAFFGYLSSNPTDVAVPIDASKNHMFPLPMDRGQPIVFKPGRHWFDYEVPFDGAPLTWLLNGRTATASSGSLLCTSPPPCAGGEARNADGSCPSPRPITQDTTKTCTGSSDCGPFRCLLTGGTCGSNADCPTTSVCQGTSQSCTSSADCTELRCRTGGLRCSTAGAACQPLGVCADASGASDGKPTVYCRDTRDCPQTAPGPGSTCSADGASCASSPCAQIRQARCTYTGEDCTATGFCRPVRPGACSDDPSHSCIADRECNGSTCVYPPNYCAPIDNFCINPNVTCNHVDSGNVCQAVARSCVPNLCVSAGICNAPTGTGDVCVPPLGMCQVSLTACRTDADCLGGAGDVCGKPTSRAVITKRVLKKAVEENAAVANFGLMIYWHAGEYPYYSAGAPVPAGTMNTELVSRERLVAAGCYDGTSVPGTPCIVDGVTYTRQGGLLSRYMVRAGADILGYLEQPFCGDFCPAGGATGQFVGAYYDAPTLGAVNDASTRLRLDSYKGRSTTVGGTSYTYYTPNPYFFNGGQTPTEAGFEFDDCGATNRCDAKCGGRWDPVLAPFIDTSGAPTTARANALAVGARLEKAKSGGLVTFGNTPTGCTLFNDAASALAQPERYGAYQYMDALLNQTAAAKGVDRETAKTCAPNAVVLVTDGIPDGPGDVVAGSGSPPASACTNPACGTDAGIDSGACTCRSVVAAYRLRKELGVKTVVVAFGGDATTGNGRIASDFIARAGGTDAYGDGVGPYAYTATTERELELAVQGALLDAARGSYSAAPASSTSGWQFSNRTDVSRLILDPRLDYPSWKGHLIAYDVSSGSPTVLWDAATRLEETSWWQRRVYVDGPLGPIRIAVDPTTKTVTNASALFALGLGASVDEAATIANWMLGDPRQKNPAVLGAPINSTPIEVGPPGSDPLPGGAAFEAAQRHRPSLIYMGADDGMLHAFFSQDTVVGGVTYPGGSEAFAFVPREMLATINKLHAQGGQLADPQRHLYGLANSPKVRNLCVSGCSDATSAVWKTVLVLSEGFGGTAAFALDVTSPVTADQVADPPVRRLWSTAQGSDASRYGAALGLTISVPAFGFVNSSALDDYRVMFASGYPPRGTTSTTQGRGLVVASATTGQLLATATANPANGFCGRDYSLLTDVATARDRGRDAKLNLLGAYVGDTSGNLWRYSGGTLATAHAFGCDAPLHYAPTVVQLNRDNPDSHANEIYLAQVTNSAFDDDTLGLPPSQLVILRENVGSDGVVNADLAYGGTGQIVRTAGIDICAVSGTSGCQQILPASARPAGTPSAVLKANGSGFLLFSVWFDPQSSGCGPRKLYLTIFDLTGDQLTQRYGAQVNQEVAFGSVFAAGALWVAGANGLQKIDVPGLTLTPAPTTGNSNAAGLFRRATWVEVVQ